MQQSSKIKGILYSGDIPHDTLLDMFLNWVEDNNLEFFGIVFDVSESIEDEEEEIFAEIISSSPNKIKLN